MIQKIMFIHLLNRYLLYIYYILCLVLNVENTMRDKMDMVVALFLIVENDC